MKQSPNSFSLDMAVDLSKGKRSLVRVFASLCCVIAK